ncbi:hypothetical protein Aph01nite_23920 [Acrocarpospora phusangensis]|uniref:RNA polymerase sigma-70 region 2 domain-containing protein n=1 Tax=Acrocarpospora phusangensis TaxID=1070424 RepID=A0A919Q851_9ACTN|nr:RNA polymerase sigma factor [Acrocarpospora phusangensis]GIH24082.1 hypothetical protein Aph01nite_23920 [Acrocarpospora phusangensis]
MGLRQRFEEIYLAHYPDLLAYVRRRTESPDDASDAIAETFTTAWRRIDEVPPGPQARLWLYGVARRVLANQRRGESRRSALAVRLREELEVWDEGALRSLRTAWRRWTRRLLLMVRSSSTSDPPRPTPSTRARPPRTDLPCSPRSAARSR